MEFKPATLDNGIILYSANDDEGSGDYVLIALRNGYLEFRYNTGSGELDLVMKFLIQSKSCPFPILANLTQPPNVSNLCLSQNKTMVKIQFQNLTMAKFFIRNPRLYFFSILMIFFIGISVMFFSVKWENKFLDKELLLFYFFTISAPVG